MVLYTRCIFPPREAEDGVRISVMSRHTLNDGITPDPRLEGMYDEWLQELAPPGRLVGSYYKRDLSWGRYHGLYIAFLRSRLAIPHVRELAQRAIHEDITLLCVEPTPECCHRRLLAEECSRWEPRLEIAHKMPSDHKF